METKKCKSCRRLGEKLFLKERDVLQLNALGQESFPPGQKPKKRRSAFSEYGKELRESRK